MNTPPNKTSLASENAKPSFPGVYVILGLTCITFFIISTFLDLHAYAGIPLMGFFVFLALTFRRFEFLKGFAFTISILAAVSLSMYYPEYFQQVGDFKLAKLIKPLMQILMFGMGTALALEDFAGVWKMPYGVFVGVFSQFLIMPLLGWTITQVFTFPPEIAAGIILIGSCPSGLASNVMSYLAKANLALSVTVTAVTTLLAPLITPLLMMALANQFVSVDFWSMVLDITQIIIVPIGLGLIFKFLLRGRFDILSKIMPVVSMLSIALIIVLITAAGRDALLVVGPLLIFAAFIHNISGYLLGYWFARAFRVSEEDCRTVALEVGMQNGGLASGLALSMGKLATVGLASAVFSPIMNITGSSLALWWRSRNPERQVEQNGRNAQPEIIRK